MSSHLWGIGLCCSAPRLPGQSGAPVPSSPLYLWGADGPPRTAAWQRSLVLISGIRALLGTVADAEGPAGPSSCRVPWKRWEDGPSLLCWRGDPLPPRSVCDLSTSCSCLISASSRLGSHGELSHEVSQVTDSRLLSRPKLCYRDDLVCIWLLLPRCTSWEWDASQDTLLLRHVQTLTPPVCGEVWAKGWASSTTSQGLPTAGG